MRRVPLHRWLAVIPALLLLVGVPFANGVTARVMGIPFLLFWIVGCVVLTSLIMALVGALDARLATHERGGPSHADSGDLGSR